MLPRLAALRHSVGVSISQREVQRLLTDQQDGFLDEARDVLRAGHTDCVVNEAAFGYMRSRGLAGPLIARLSLIRQRGGRI